MSPTSVLRAVRYRPWDALLGVLTVVPMAFFGLAASAGPDAPGLAVLAVLVLVLVAALVVLFVRHATRTLAVPRQRRPIWILGLILGAVLVLPVYWWRFVWRANR